MRNGILLTRGLAAMALALVLISGVLNAADHRDGPRTTNAAATLGALDLNDLYMFVSPTTPANSVLILTTGGANVGVLSPPFFLPGAVFEYRISNDGVATDDELVYQFVFSNPDQFLRQTFTAVQITRIGTATRSQVLATGITGRQVTMRNGTKIQCGLFDDPFFFDSQAFGKFRTATQQGLPLGQRVAPFLPPNVPNNSVFSRNTLAIVMEVPRLQIQKDAGSPNISCWIRSLSPDGTQFDRTGLPAINTATLFPLPLLGLPSLQDAFNSLKPSDDVGLRGVAAQRINLIYGLPLTGTVANGGPNATALAGVVLPDVMPFNTTSTAGFLNGRKLTDDVIDAELNLLTGGALTTDRVNVDSTFLTTFPYLAAPVP